MHTTTWSCLIFICKDTKFVPQSSKKIVTQDGLFISLGIEKKKDICYNKKANLPYSRFAAHIVCYRKIGGLNKAYLN